MTLNGTPVSFEFNTGLTHLASHTLAAGSDRYAVMMVLWEDFAGTGTFSLPLWDGNAMTQIGTLGVAGGVVAAIYVYDIGDGESTGAKNFSITRSGSTGFGSMLCWVVNDADAPGTTSGEDYFIDEDTSGSTVSSGALTNSTDDTILGAAITAAGARTWSNDMGQTDFNDIQPSGGCRIEGGSSISPSANATVTFTQSAGAGQDKIGLFIVIPAASGGGGGGPTPETGVPKGLERGLNRQGTHMAYYRQYGQGTGADVIVPHVKAAGGALLGADWTPATGDVKISKDGAAAANIATLPTYVTDVGWKYVFSDAELQAGISRIRLAAAVTEATLPDGFDIETIGHPSAQHSTGSRGTLETTIATLSSQTVFTLTDGSDDDDAYNGWTAIIEDASGQYQVAHETVSDYDGGTQQVTLVSDPGIFTVAASDLVTLLPPLGSASLGGLQSDVTDLLSDVGDIDTDVTTLLSDLGDVSMNVTSLISDVGDVDTDVTTLLSDVGDVDTDVTSLISAVGAVDTDVTTLLSDVGGIATDVGTLLTNVGILLTRIPAALFAGITSLADWLGAMAGKHTADATAITEINATGAGSGTFDEADDSQEGISDGAAGGGATAQQVWEYDISNIDTADLAGEQLNDAAAGGGGGGGGWQGSDDYGISRVDS